MRRLFTRLQHSTLLFTLCLILQVTASCRAARYEIIGPEKVKGTEPPLPPCDDCKENQEPSADLEAMHKGKAVTAIPTGETVTLRPTADTLDPDDFGKENVCKYNPGIVSAKYAQIELKIEETVTRSSCENLSIEHTFTQAGLYFIELEVSSNEDEKALASMTLVVFNPADQQPPRKGFDIEANPIITEIGKEIVFTSNCEKEHKETTGWDLGDGEKSSGAEIRKSYTKSGSYEINATCNEMRASLTIVILEKDHDIDLEKAPIKKPGTNPGSTDPNQKDPNQKNPNQKT